MSACGHGQGGQAGQRGHGQAGQAGATPGDRGQIRWRATKSGPPARIPDEGQGRHDAAIPELVAGDGADREVQVQLVAGDGASVSATAQEEGMSRAQYEKVVGC